MAALISVEELSSGVGDAGPALVIANKACASAVTVRFTDGVGGPALTIVAGAPGVGEYGYPVWDLFGPAESAVVLGGAATDNVRSFTPDYPGHWLVRLTATPYGGSATTYTALVAINDAQFPNASTPAPNETAEASATLGWSRLVEKMHRTVGKTLGMRELVSVSSTGGAITAGTLVAPTAAWHAKWKAATADKTAYDNFVVDVQAVTDASPSLLTGPVMVLLEDVDPATPAQEKALALLKGVYVMDTTADIAGTPAAGVAVYADGTAGDVFNTAPPGTGDRLVGRIITHASDSATPPGAVYFDGHLEAFFHNLYIGNKLTVGGLIDPTGLELTPVAANPGGAPNNTIWVDSADGAIKVGPSALARKPSIGKLLTVAPSGGDYTSIVAAVTAASSLTPSASNRIVIEVQPGSYTETNPIAVPSYVSIVGVAGPQGTQVAFSNTNQHGFVCGSDQLVSGLHLSGADDAGYAAIHIPASSVGVRVRDIAYSACDYGVYAQCTADGSSVFGLLADPSLAGTYGILVDGGGHLVVSHAELSETAALTDFARATGSGSVLHIMDAHLDCTGTVSGLHALSGGSIRATGVHVHSATNGIRVGASGTVHAVGCDIQDSATYDLLVEDSTSVAFLSGTAVAHSKSGLNPAAEVHGLALDQEGGFASVLGNLSVGTPGAQRSSYLGSGRPYSAGMVVKTTDDTANSVSDGGSLVDVSAAAATGASFTFQGTTVNHTILFGSIRTDDSGALLKHWALLLDVATASSLDGAYVVEIWDGAAWAEVSCMSVGTQTLYRYGSTLFIRANSSETVRLGVKPSTTWASKTIGGVTAYWSRIRISSTTTTAPTFTRAKVASGLAMFTESGVHVGLGAGQWVKTLTVVGNMFSTSNGGKVSETVGTGASPASWTHTAENSKLNDVNDSAQFHFVLPRGVDTSHKATLTLKYMVTGGTGDPAGDMVVAVGALPLPCASVKVADPSGGATPVARTLANTASVTTTAATTHSFSPTVDARDKLESYEVPGIDISGVYEGDILVATVVLSGEGANANDLSLFAAEVSVVMWTAGERLS